MTGTSRRHRKISGFTLVEILVIFGIIIVLVGLAASILMRVKDSSKSVVCLNNLKQIAGAIQMYHSDFRTMPNQIYPLLQDAGYIADAGTFRCPADVPGSNDSYDPFYIPRSLSDSQKLFLGCPRHGRNAVAVFGWPQFNIARTCAVLWNGSPVAQGTVVQGGELLFEDGTRVVIDGSLPVGVMLSTVDQNKQVYSTICVQEGDLGNGTMTITHPEGVKSQFEVLTPSLITGVAGTVFQVKTQWPDSTDPTVCSTTITCTEGKVNVEDRNAAAAITAVEAQPGKPGTHKAKTKIASEEPTSPPDQPGNSHPKPWWWHWWKK